MEGTGSNAWLDRAPLSRSLPPRPRLLSPPEPHPPRYLPQMMPLLRPREKERRHPPPRRRKKRIEHNHSPNTIVRQSHTLPRLPHTLFNPLLSHLAGRPSLLRRSAFGVGCSTQYRVLGFGPIHRLRRFRRLPAAHRHHLVRPPKPVETAVDSRCLWAAPSISFSLAAAADASAIDLDAICPIGR